MAFEDKCYVWDSISNLHITEHICLTFCPLSIIILDRIHAIRVNMWKTWLNMRSIGVRNYSNIIWSRRGRERMIQFKYFSLWASMFVDSYKRGFCVCTQNEICGFYIFNIIYLSFILTVVENFDIWKLSRIYFIECEQKQKSTEITLNICT